MEKQETEGFAQAITIAFIGGALLGVGAALLLAPRSGRETRTLLKDYAKKAEEEVFEKAQKVKNALEACHDMCREHMKEHV